MIKFKKILQRVVPVLCILSIVLMNCVVVSATTEEDYGIDESKICKYSLDNYYQTKDGVALYSLPFQYKGFYTTIKESNVYQSYQAPTYIYKIGTSNFIQQMYPSYVPSQGSTQFWRYDFDISCFDYGYFLDISGLDDNSKLYLNLRFQYVLTSGSVISINQPVCSKMTVSYYDSQGRFISSQVSTVIKTTSYSDGIGIESSLTLTKPIGAKYCSMGLNLDNFGFTGDSAVGFNFRLVEFFAYLGLPSKIVPQNFMDIADGSDFSDPDGFHFFYMYNDNFLGSSNLTSNDPDNASKSGSYNKISFYADSGSDTKYNVRFRMFYPNRYLSLDNIPSGTPAGFSFDFHISAIEDFKWPIVHAQIAYYDSNYQQISSAVQRFNFGDTYTKVDNNEGGAIEQQFIIEYPPEAKYLCVHMYIDNIWFFGDSSNFLVTVSNPNIYMFFLKFPYVIRDDDSSNDFPTGDDLGDGLGNVTGSINTNRPDLNAIDVNISGLVDMNSFLAVTNTISAFWDSPLLSSILIALLTISLISWVLFGQKG